MFFFFDPLEQFNIVNFLDFYFFYISNILLIITLNAFVIFFYLTIFLKKVKTSNNSLILISKLYEFFNSIISENLKIEKQIFSPLLFLIFIFILFSNMIGMVPYNLTITSYLVFTFFFSLMVWLAVNILCFLVHKSDANWIVLLPNGIPTAIKPILVLIELLSHISKVVSLTIRLFANMMSGHALLKILIGFGYNIICLFSVYSIFSIIPIFVVFAVMFLETVIAFLQGYVFITLLAIYISEAFNMH